MTIKQIIARLIAFAGYIAIASLPAISPKLTILESWLIFAIALIITYIVYNVLKFCTDNW